MLDWGVQGSDGRNSTAAEPLARLITGGTIASARVLDEGAGWLELEMGAGSVQPALGEHVSVLLPTETREIEARGVVVQRRLDETPRLVIQILSSQRAHSRRGWLRVRVTLPVTITAQDRNKKRYTGWSRDLTPSGAAVWLPQCQSLEAGELTQFVVRWPEASEIRADAEIVEIAPVPAGSGSILRLRFVEIPPEDRDRLTTYLLGRQTA
jgi:c-di-GMP-binding flagellar brake protein YcgR